MAGSAPLLEVRDLSRSFGGIAALAGVSVDVDAGETVSIIGPNGAGKTTLFNIITGLEKADGGSIRFCGREILGFRADRIAALGMGRTFQNGRVFANMSVLDNVLAGGHARYLNSVPGGPAGCVPEVLAAIARLPGFRAAEEVRRRDAAAILAGFGERLLPRSGSRAFSLSYANRRRLELARALAGNPRILFLDEPTAGMNPVETAEMLKTVRALKAGGQTIVLIEHKLSIVMELSDRVYVLDGGRVIASGAPAVVAADSAVVEAYLGHSRGWMAGPGANAARGAGATAARRTTGESPAGAPVAGGERLAASAGPADLVVEGIDTFYGSFQAHFGVSVRVPAGKIVCLLGGNASGKSTLMKAILGLVKPRAGKIRFGTADLVPLDTAAIVRLGIASVPEARRIFPAMTVRENLLVGATVHRDGIDEDLDRMVALFPRLGERLNQAGGTLSGGEQQMLAIARALMARPRLICMDEPTMGLSPRLVDLTLEYIERINRQGISVFMVEQNANLALQVAHYGFVIQGGRIVLEGTAASLAVNPGIREAYLGTGAER